MRLAALSVLVALVAGCRSSAPVDVVPVDRAPTTSAAVVTRSPSPSPGCGTAKEAEAADVLRLVRGEPSLVLYANAQVGLLVVDVTRPGDPKLVSMSPFVGAPVGAFANGNVAFLVFSPWDRGPETVVRAIALDRGRIGERVGEITLPGAPRDAWRVGDAVVVTRERGVDAPGTLVTTFTAVDGRLVQRDSVALDGGGAVTGASPTGVAVARVADPSLGPDRTAVTWLGVADDGALHQGGTATVAGVVPRWRRAQDHAIDVTEDGQVRVVACATAACPAGESAAYASIDFAEPWRPRTTAWRLLARAGTGVFAFTGSRMLVARPTDDGADATDLVVFRTDDELTRVGAARLEGTASSIVPLTMPAEQGRAVVLGWRGKGPESRVALLHHVDVRRTPRRVGSVAFGGAFAWSPAYDDDRAISFDPQATLAALPMTTLREGGDARSEVQVFSFAESGPAAVLEKEAAAERVLFVDGWLLAFSVDGVSVVAPPGGDRRWRTWTELKNGDLPTAP